MKIKYLLEKEFKQFFRNAFIPKMVIIYPLLVMLVIPLITNLDIKNLDICIVDKDNSSSSRKLIQKIDASNYFVLDKVVHKNSEAIEEIENGNIDAILEIESDFEKHITNGTNANIQISANAVDGLKGGLGSSYLASIINEFSGDSLASVSIQHKYNPLLDYKRFMIPALIVILLILLCGLLPALNIVNEKEVGTIEQLNVSPISKLQLILAKLIPYWIMGLVILSICIIIVWLVYSFVPAGSLFIIYLVSILFILIMSGFGILISNISSSMQQALFVVFFFMMIFMLISGLFTPFNSMPQWARIFSSCLPPRYFIEIMRDVYLKGSGIIDLYPKFLILTGFVILINFWAILTYRKQE